MDMKEFLTYHNLYLLILLLTLGYYIILIPLCFRAEAMHIWRKNFAGSKGAASNNLTQAFLEYREWLALVEKLRADQKVQAANALDNTVWLKQEPYRKAVDLDQVWKDKIHRQQLMKTKNQTNIS
ncbi:hypothetical protein ACFOUP_12885 [Belliella kenyensis]|uniref:Uncharacterized protein n=1 Tax=Belliella kenyensis TaxID=1472724 RepID=A0ABV8EMN5_9BACT|nr:hypothetical protein [Belliella kenyensis]MCH7400869.1 hypothetical protein [Belliella kenyensis]MDN3601844.1 hypothetical protein [Belliella kenyensis]